MPGSEIILYQTEDGETKIEVRLENDTVWLTLNQIAELFQKAKSTISEHIKNIYNEGELPQEATVRNFRTVQTEKNRSVSRDLEHYNLDVIISVGYRVKSLQGTKHALYSLCSEIKINPLRGLDAILGLIFYNNMTSTRSRLGTGENGSQAYANKNCRASFTLIIH